MCVCVCVYIYIYIITYMHTYKKSNLLTHLLTCIFFPQGLMMGLMAVAGTAGRMLGPVFIGHMYTSYGPRVAFIGSALIVAVFILMLLGTFRRFDTNSRKKESACGIENQGHELLESWMAPRQTHLD